MFLDQRFDFLRTQIRCVRVILCCAQLLSGTKRVRGGSSCMRTQNVPVNSITNVV